MPRLFDRVDRGLLYYTAEIIASNRDAYRELPVIQGGGLQIPKKMTIKPLDSSKDVLKLLEHDTLETNAQLNHPGFIAHMDPPTPSIAIAAALIQIATNNNLLHPDVAPKARPIEKRVIEWLAPYFHMGGGHMVPGSTVANLTSLWAARETRKITSVIASDKSHLSVKKAVLASAHLL